MGNREVIDMLGVKIDNVSIDEVLVLIRQLIKNGDPSYAVTPNADHIVKLQSDPEFKEAYSNAALVLADGMIVLWAAKFLGTPLKEKVSGSDLLPKICEVAQDGVYKLFFLGGKPGSASKAAEVLKAKYPNIKIVGVYSPPFGFENDKGENDAIIKMISDAKPDMLFIGLGAPKQEKWIYKYKNEYRAPVSIGVGGTFEFISGMVRRAPRWMQQSGLEWFWRLIMEPRRLWKRYLVDDMVFFWLVLRQKMRKII